MAPRVKLKEDDSRDNHCLSGKRLIVIQIIYIIAAVMWIILLYCLQVYHHGRFLGYAILTIPIFVYALGFLYARRVTKEVRAQMSKADVVSVTLLFITAILTNVDRDSSYTIHIMLVATFLVLLSLIDFWTSSKALEVIQVIKSISQTAAITLLVYVLYIHFATRSGGHTIVLPGTSNDLVK